MENNIDTMVQGAGSEAHEQQPAEKTFTQDEVNRIVQERLARAKNSQQDNSQLIEREKSLDDREASILLRENKMKCHEFITKKGYSKEFLDILDTQDPEKFQEQAEKLVNIGVGIKRYPGTTENPRNSRGSGTFSDVKHTPKKFDSGW